MSFGFPKNHDAVSEAISNVRRQRQRRVVFLSSAGNSSSEKESFPARHPNVISVFATNYKGVFSSSNAKIDIGDKVVMGTFGDDIPRNIYDAFEERYPGVCRPGSSIATAVTAGISVTMLAYAEVLPKLLPPNLRPECRQLEWLRVTEGMEAVLKKAMARSQADQIQTRFLDPASFWRDISTDFKRLCSILTSLADVDKEGELHTGSE